MLHAVERVLAINQQRDLSHLDRDRLLALKTFLAREFNKDVGSVGAAFASWGMSSVQEPLYSFEFNPTDFLKKIPSFKKWKPKLHSSAKKIDSLLSTLETYSNSLFNDKKHSNEPPKEELEILKEMLMELLLRTESALQE